MEKALEIKKVDEQNLEILSTVPESSIWLANFVSARTRQTYLNAVSEFAMFSGIKSDADWKKINQAHVIAWRDGLIKNGASDRTVNNRLSAISSLYKHLLEKRVAEINPVNGIKRIRISKDRVESPILTKKQVRKMLDAPGTSDLKGLRNTAILSTLFYTGCRVSEVCNLKVSDFYEDAGYKVLDFTVKGGRKHRVAINQELVLALQSYLDVSLHGQEPESPLFLALQRAELRKHLTSRQIERIFSKYALIAGIPDNPSPHSARATFVTLALERKCPIEAVQRTVGHIKISTTQMYDKRFMKHRESASLAITF